MRAKIKEKNEGKVRLMFQDEAGFGESTELKTVGARRAFGRMFHVIISMNTDMHTKW